MRVLVLTLVLVSCAAIAPPGTPSPSAPLVVPATVPNGRVEMVLRPTYGLGEHVKITVRLLPSSGTLRGPLQPYIQASGFHGTAIVRHLVAIPVTASAGGTGETDLTWDQTDDARRAVPADDYSVVLAFLDDLGRRTTVGATITVR